MSKLDYPRMVGDVGGTNARWAWVQAEGDEPTRVRIYPCALFPTISDVMRRYLADESLPVPAACAIGIANPVTGDHIKMTNHDWAFSIEAVRQELGFGRFVVVNDFTALALALPALTKADLRQLGGGAAVPGAPIAILGPGTGLGVSGLLATRAGQWVPLAGEGGHVTLSPSNPREVGVVNALAAKFGHASAERALSGPGLVNLYEALCGLDGIAPQPFDAAAVSTRALDGSDAHCAEALEIFCAFLGSVAGNLALTLGATGGIYIGGGIVPRLGDYFWTSQFRERLEAKGRFKGWLATMPVYVIEATVSPALLGASRALEMA